MSLQEMFDELKENAAAAILEMYEVLRGDEKNVADLLRMATIDARREFARRQQADPVERERKTPIWRIVNKYKESGELSEYLQHRIFSGTTTAYSRNVLATHINKFPEKMKDELIAAFCQEALENKNVAPLKGFSDSPK
jgi:hypothetical protein